MTLVAAVVVGAIPVRIIGSPVTVISGGISVVVRPPVILASIIMAAVVVAATMAKSEVYAESAAVAAVMAGVVMATVVTAVMTSTPCKSVIDKAESEQRHRQCDSRQYIS